MVEPDAIDRCVRDLEAVGYALIPGAIGPEQVAGARRPLRGGDGPHPART